MRIPSHSSFVCNRQSPAREPSVKPHEPSANPAALSLAVGQFSNEKQFAFFK